MKVKDVPDLERKVLDILPIKQADIWKKLEIDDRECSELISIMLKKGLIKKTRKDRTYLIEFPNGNGNIKIYTEASVETNTNVEDTSIKTELNDIPVRMRKNIHDLQQQVLDMLPITQSEVWKKLDIDHRYGSKLINTMLKENLIKKTKQGGTYLIEKLDGDGDIKPDIEVPEKTDTDTHTKTDIDIGEIVEIKIETSDVEIETDISANADIITETPISAETDVHAKTNTITETTADAETSVNADIIAETPISTDTDTHAKTGTITEVPVNTETDIEIPVDEDIDKPEKTNVEAVHIRAEERDISSLRHQVLSILPMIQSEIWKKLGIDRRSCSRLINDMIKYNLVKKTKQGGTYLIESLNGNGNVHVKDFKALLSKDGTFSPCCGCLKECRPGECPSLTKWVLC